MNVARSHRRLALLVAAAALSAAAVAAHAEQSQGWYGAVDLGVNRLGKPVTGTSADCARLKGVVAKHADGRMHCDVPKKARVTATQRGKVGDKPVTGSDTVPAYQF